MLKYLIEHPDIANALATIFSAVTAIVAAAVAIWALFVQRRHNRMSVRPIPEVTRGDYENSIYVKLCNHGVGPLVVRRVIVTKGKESRESIYDWLPELTPERAWTNFAVVDPGRTVKPNGDVVLVELTQEENEVDFASNRDLARNLLSQLVVTIEYSDVYGSKLSPCIRSLDWFARTQGRDGKHKKRH